MKLIASAAQQTQRKPVEQDKAATPASNDLVEDDDLQKIGCAYLSDYDIIVCRNTHKGKPCGYAVPLASLLAHCWGESSSAHDLHTCDRSPHLIKFCERQRSSKGGRSAYNFQQRDFVQKILDKFPNVVATTMELRDLRMLSNQFGPIQYIRPPISGYTCRFCDFATYDTGRDGGEPLAMREHWQKHCRENPEKYHPAPRGKDLRETNNFIKCQVQSFDLDRCNALWMRVPPGPDKQLTGPSKSFSELLISGLRTRTTKSLPKESSSAHQRKTVLPFFVQNGAYDLISPLNPESATKLISLPARNEPLLRKLKLAVVQRFEKLCDEIPKMTDRVCELLVAPRPLASTLSSPNFAY